MTSDSSRPYRKRERALREQQTRLRITEAAVELHRTLGPANTSVTDVAKLAGVSRMTVYNHFPTEVDLFTACSTHWATENPFPTPSDWAVIDDPGERLITALNELYSWYELKEDMLGKVLRDIHLVPALSEVMGALWQPYVDQIVETLSVGWDRGEGAPLELTAALGLVVNFDTWRGLTGSGLDPGQAAVLAAHMVTHGVPSSPSGR